MPGERGELLICGQSLIVASAQFRHSLGAHI
jgi:hypothetical protein